MARKRWISSSFRSDAVVLKNERRWPILLRRNDGQRDLPFVIRFLLLASDNGIDAVLHQFPQKHLRPV